MSAIRGGTVLIVIAGVSAITATLCAAFLMRMRGDVEEMVVAEREAQARLMLIAACTYVQEGSRLGYHVPGATVDGNDEAFGWIDVRNGKTGPLGAPRTAAASSDPRTDFLPYFSDALVEDRDGDGAADRPAWPAIGGVARCPMYAMRLPPCAVQLTVAYNPIGDDGRPWLSHRDPLPVATSAAQFRQGDPSPRPDSVGLSWFRAYRDEPAVFILTCGAGATQGFRDWAEVRGAHAEDQFGGDQRQFEQLLLQETRRWYRIEWSAAVAPSEVHNVANALWKWPLANDELASPRDQYIQFSMNTSDSANAQQPDTGIPMRSQAHCVNMGGTIRWVQRLRLPPSEW